MNAYNGNVPMNSPSTTCSSDYSTTTHDFIGLPQDLGQKPQQQKLLRSGLDAERERAAQVKAQELLQQACGVGPTPSEPVSEDNGLAARVVAVQTYKEKKRLSQIQQLEQIENDKDGVAARKAAILRYKLKKTQEMRGVKPNEEVRVLKFNPRKEVLATTTRKKKAVNAEEDCDNINDYKCKYDLEREQEAKYKALDLLKEFGF